MGSHSVTCHPAEVTFPPLPPAEAGTRLSDPGGMQGWVDLVNWPSKCVSQVGSSIESSWFLARELPSTYPIMCWKEIWVSTKITDSTSSGTLSQTPDVKNLLRRIDRRNVLSTLLDKGGRSERNKLDRRRSAKLTIPPSSDVRPLVYHSNRQALSTTLFRRGGLWATADTCVIMWLKIRGLSFKNRKNSLILCLPFYKVR